MRHEDAAGDDVDMEERVLLLLLLCLCSSGLWAEDTTVEEFDGVRLLRANNCTARLKTEHLRGWRTVTTNQETITASVCRKLNCGSAVTLRVEIKHPTFLLDVTCLESIRLVNGSDRCSGRLEVNTNQLWSPVCEGDFDQQDAQVVCRELGCGTLPVLQGAPYGEVESPEWSREFHCEGHEQHLLDCNSSTPARESCSAARTVELTCSDSDDVRLVGGANQCSGELQLRKSVLWTAVEPSALERDPDVLNMICRQLDCGSIVSTEITRSGFYYPVWRINLSCVKTKDSLSGCIREDLNIISSSKMEVTCSESIRLVNGYDRCSGRLEVKTNLSWSSVCESDFDQQNANVVCEELACGAPLVFRGALYGEVEAPVWTGKFWCEGNERHLLDCRRSDAAVNTCSPEEAVGITCSGQHPIRLMGEKSRCAGKVRMKARGQWRPVSDLGFPENQMLADIVCSRLDCGSVAARGTISSTSERKWFIESSCFLSGSIDPKCELRGVRGFPSVEVICTGLLTQPNITVFPPIDVDSTSKPQRIHVLVGYDFTITCSTQDQYQGGSFQLLHNSSNTVKVYVQPAVNHSAHFNFSTAARHHQGEYTCVYSVHVYSQNFSSESRTIQLFVSALLIELMIRLVIHLLVLTALISSHFVFARYLRNQRRLNGGRRVSTC